MNLYCSESFIFIVEKYSLVHHNLFILLDVLISGFLFF